MILFSLNTFFSPQYTGNWNIKPFSGNLIEAAFSSLGTVSFSQDDFPDIDCYCFLRLKFVTVLFVVFLDFKRKVWVGGGPDGYYC